MQNVRRDMADLIAGVSKDYLYRISQAQSCSCLCKQVTCINASVNVKDTIRSGQVTHT